MWRARRTASRACSGDAGSPVRATRSGLPGGVEGGDPGGDARGVASLPDRADPGDRSGHGSDPGGADAADRHHSPSVPDKAAVLVVLRLRRGDPLLGRLGAPGREVGQGSGGVDSGIEPQSQPPAQGDLQGSGHDSDRSCGAEPSARGLRPALHAGDEAEPRQADRGAENRGHGAGDVEARGGVRPSEDNELLPRPRLRARRWWPMDPAEAVENANSAFPTAPWTAQTARRPQAPQARRRLRAAERGRREGEIPSRRQSWRRRRDLGSRWGSRTTSARQTDSRGSIRASAWPAALPLGPITWLYPLGESNEDVALKALMDGWFLCQEANPQTASWPRQNRNDPPPRSRSCPSDRSRLIGPGRSMPIPSSVQRRSRLDISFYGRRPGLGRAAADRSARARRFQGATAVCETAGTG